MFSKIMNGKKGGKTVIRLMSKDGKRACPDNLVGFFQRLEKTNCSAEGCSRCDSACWPYRRKWKENMLWI